jgi:aconitate hydratase
MLPLTFANPDDYDKVREDDKIDLEVKNIAPGSQVKMILKHSDNTEDEIMLNHTMNKQQIDWFKVGSALNLMAKMKK